MKKLINTILLSLFLSNVSLAGSILKLEQNSFEQNSFEQNSFEPKQLETISLIQPPTQSGKKTNINQKLEDIEEILKYVALMQVKTEETSQKQSSIKSSTTNSNTKVAKALTLAKEGFWNMVGAGKFVVDKADKIISKKFLITACLVLGPAVYVYTKLKPNALPDMTEVITEKITDAGIKMGEQIVDGAVQSAINNPKTVAKIVGISMGATTAIKLTEEIAKNLAPEIIKLTNKSFVILGGCFAWIAKKIFLNGNPSLISIGTQT